MRKIAKQIPIFLIFLFCFLLIGGIELFAYDPSKNIATSQFIFTLVTVNIANMIALTSTARLIINRGRLEDKDVLDKDKKLKDTININVDSSFDNYLITVNKDRKILAWKTKISDKITRLESRARQKDIELFNFGTEQEKIKNRYCSKRRRLLVKLEDDYINKNLPYLKVKYIKLRRYEITTGTTQKGEDYQITTNTSNKIFKDNIPKFLITFSIILLFVSIPLTFSEWKEEIIMIVILRLIPLFMNIANGKEYGKSYITHTILGDLQFRLDTVINYMEWKLNKRGEINESKTFM